MAKNITKDNFKKKLSRRISRYSSIFWATWCAPCRMLTPSIDKLSKTYADKVVVGKINVDEQRELAQQFGVMSIPSVFVLKDGKVIDSIVGVKPINYYEGVLDKALAKLTDQSGYAGGVAALHTT